MKTYKVTISIEEIKETPLLDELGRRWMAKAMKPILDKIETEMVKEWLKNIRI